MGLLFRRSDREKLISDDFGEWILLKNGSVSWTLQMIEKAFKKIKLKPLKVYSLYFSVEKGLKELVDLKAMIITDRTRLRSDIMGEISRHAHASVSTLKLVLDGPVAMWFVSLTSIPERSSDEPYYNMFYPYGIESSRIPYTFQDLMTTFISRAKKCEVVGFCRKGTTLNVLAKCNNGEINEHEVWESIKYFADGLEIEREYKTFRLIIKGFKKTRIIPLVWDDLSDIPEGC